MAILLTGAAAFFALMPMIQRGKAPIHGTEQADARVLFCLLRTEAFQPFCGPDHANRLVMLFGDGSQFAGALGGKFG